MPTHWGLKVFNIGLANELIVGDPATTGVGVEGDHAPSYQARGYEGAL